VRGKSKDKIRLYYNFIMNDCHMYTITGEERKKLETIFSKPRSIKPTPRKYQKDKDKDKDKDKNNDNDEDTGKMESGEWISIKNRRKDYTIKTYINSGLLKESQPLYITINPHSFNLELIQFLDPVDKVEKKGEKDENGDAGDEHGEVEPHITIATFYENFQYTATIRELLLIPSAHIRIVLKKYTYSCGSRFDLYLTVNLTKHYLEDLRFNEEYLLLFKKLVHSDNRFRFGNNEGVNTETDLNLPGKYYPGYRYSFDPAPEIGVSGSTLEDITQMENTHELGKGLCNTEQRHLYPHQIENIHWMTRIEKNIHQWNGFSEPAQQREFLTSEHNLGIPSQEQDHQKIFVSQHFQNRLGLPKCLTWSTEDSLEMELGLNPRHKYITFNSDADIPHFYPCGGVLSDQVGLGKTFSMLGLIRNNPSSDNKPTLVLCPRRLCKQWQEEIMYMPAEHALKCVVISSITQFRKLVKENPSLDGVDVMVTSYNFLTNTNYQNYCSSVEEEKAQNTEGGDGNDGNGNGNGNDEDHTNFIIHKFHWHRVILDEGHEIFSYARKRCMLDIRYEILRIPSTYRWMCTGTPLAYYLDSWIVLDYLYPNLFSENDEPFNSSVIQNRIMTNEYRYRHLLRNIIDKLFIRHTHQSVEKMKVDIPKPVINTEFLNFSEVERNFYDSLQDRGKKLQLCTHLQNIQHHMSILGVKPLTLEEINEKMTDYYQVKLDKLLGRIKRVENERAKVEKLLVEASGSEEIRQSRHNRIGVMNGKIEHYQKESATIQSKLMIFQGLDERLQETENCPVCWEKLADVTQSVTPCGHLICYNCLQTIAKHSTSLECPMCRFSFEKNEIQMISKSKEEEDAKDADSGKDAVGGDKGEDTEESLINKWGTKFARMLQYVDDILDADPTHRVIIFSQWDKTLTMVQKALTSVERASVVIQGQIYTIQARIHRFRTDPSCRVVLLSSSKNASGVNLTEASHVVLLDSLNTTSEEARLLEEQAIGRAVRLGQTRQVQVRRFIIRNTIEHDFYLRNIGVTKYQNVQQAVIDGEEDNDQDEITLDFDDEVVEGIEGDEGGGNGMLGNMITNSSDEPSPMVI